MSVTAESTAFRPSIQGWIARATVMVIVLEAILLAVKYVPNFWADRIALAAVYAIIGLSLNVVLGYTGQVSLGHHAFVGLAAFASAFYVTEKAGCEIDSCSMTSFSVAMLIAILSGALSAGLLGLVALRIKGLYLALITLTYGFVAVNSIFEIPALTRGGAGMPAPRPDMFSSDKGFAYLCLIALAIAIYVDWRVVRSKVGRAILAVKHSEAVAASYAVNVTSYKVIAFMLSGAFAGMAGSLFAHRVETVVAADFNFQVALLWVLMVVVGGLGRRVGVVIGSAFFALFPYLIQLVAPLNHFLEDTLKRDPEEFTLVIGPVLALLTIIQYPGGIAEQLSPVSRWLSGQRFSMHPDGHGKAAKHKGGLGKLVSRGGKHSPTPEAAAPVTSDDESPTKELESVGKGKGRS
ncbi:MAG TPA: branched-chain amino acid ABC transporter permease [Actinomycetota bacterium]|nr:branched-chain amino acid ABC transporter permease [Actinomycetota bacterium]